MSLIIHGTVIVGKAVPIRDCDRFAQCPDEVVGCPLVGKAPLGDPRHHDTDRDAITATAASESVEWGEPQPLVAEVPREAYPKDALPKLFRDIRRVKFQLVRDFDIRMDRKGQTPRSIP